MALSGKSLPAQVYDGRVTEQYLLSQVNGMRELATHLEHKERLSDFDKLYRGELNSLFPEEAALTNIPVVENKLKNATHDIARLAKEAKGTPIFMRQGDTQKQFASSQVRASISSTIWQMGGGPRLEGKLYIDLIAAGYCAVSAYKNSESDYPQFLRLDPRQCYPDVVNGSLVNMLYVENLLERHAAHMFPDAGLSDDPKSRAEVFLVMYYDSQEAVQAILTQTKGKATRTHVTSRWEHKLGCVPVGFAQLDSADGTFHGLFDQLGGPLMIRNKTIRLLADYLESMVYAPFEEKAILNGDDEPSPTRIYHHDPNAPESFMRRVQPATSAGSVFGLLGYMDSQEAAEAIQPPSRVGVVSQSIASGSFVASTQGTLSSVVKELQEKMAGLRYDLNCLAFRIEQKFLDFEKPLLVSIGKKSTYIPSVDMGDFMYHTIQYGASAGLNRSEADVRVLQHRGAGLISKKTARAQIDYIEDEVSEQAMIDQEEMANAFFQRWAGDPNTPMSTLAKAIVDMSKNGKTLTEVVADVAPELLADEDQKKALKAAELLPPDQQGQPQEQGEVPPEANQQALEAGAQGVENVQPKFAPPPLSQIITRNPIY